MLLRCASFAKDVFPKSIWVKHLKETGIFQFINNMYKNIYYHIVNYVVIYLPIQWLLRWTLREYILHLSSNQARTVPVESWIRLGDCLQMQAAGNKNIHIIKFQYRLKIQSVNNVLSFIFINKIFDILPDRLHGETHSNNVQQTILLKLVCLSDTYQ